MQELIPEFLFTYLLIILESIFTNIKAAIFTMAAFIVLSMFLCISH